MNFELYDRETSRLLGQAGDVVAAEAIAHYLLKDHAIIELFKINEDGTRELVDGYVNPTKVLGL